MSSSRSKNILQLALKHSVPIEDESITDQSDQSMIDKSLEYKENLDPAVYLDNSIRLNSTEKYKIGKYMSSLSSGRTNETPVFTELQPLSISGIERQTNVILEFENDASDFLIPVCEAIEFGNEPFIDINPNTQSVLDTPESGTLNTSEHLNISLPLNSTTQFSLITPTTSKKRVQPKRAAKSEINTKHSSSFEIQNSTPLNGELSGSSFHPDTSKNNSSSDYHTSSDKHGNGSCDKKQKSLSDTFSSLPSSNISSQSDNLPSKVDSSFLQTMVSDNKKYNYNAGVERSKKHNLTNKRIFDRKDTCIFCDKLVTNFTRHISRKHSEEIEVARFLSLPKRSTQRKRLADKLRKKGNFLCNVSNTSSIIPVRRPNELRGSLSAKDFLRHVKKCMSKENEPGTNRTNVQAESETLLLIFGEEDVRLVQDVFPRMIPDEISSTVKNDPLIRAFGSRYLKCHKEKHLITVVSCKMRELARLLLEMQKTTTACKTLLNCLKPSLFDLIVKATKSIAGYDNKTDKFSSPSLILKIGTSLKQCCDIAEYLILKESQFLRQVENPEQTLRSVKTLQDIISKQWSYELSTNACKDIYQKKWNKPALLPLTSDLKIFRDYLLSLQKSATESLKNDPMNIDAYRTLQESILAQLILLNRKRAGEVQRIFLNSYTNSNPEIPQEEIMSSLSEVEKQLTTLFKRIVIRGKRGRGVPVLFTPKVKKSIDLLISLRTLFCENSNEYLFALPGSKNSTLIASAVMRKLAIASGVNNQESITSTKLRKQVATVDQILSFSENDIEQLVNFLGHDPAIHKTFYRLPENVFQVAKVSNGRR